MTCRATTRGCVSPPSARRSWSSTARATPPSASRTRLGFSEHARHPESFVSLAGADHLLARPGRDGIRGNGAGRVGGLTRYLECAAEARRGSRASSSLSARGRPASCRLGAVPPPRPEAPQDSRGCSPRPRIRGIPAQPRGDAGCLVAVPSLALGGRQPHQGLRVVRRRSFRRGVSGRIEIAAEIFPAIPSTMKYQLGGRGLRRSAWRAISWQRGASQVVERRIPCEDDQNVGIVRRGRQRPFELGVPAGDVAVEHLDVAEVDPGGVVGRVEGDGLGDVLSPQAVRARGSSVKPLVAMIECTIPRAVQARPISGRAAPPAPGNPSPWPRSPA